ncbi:TonB-dependent receptor [Mucilaginibacter mali]|uniref:TonB-dependent receptor n=1 Tax=Mucilaginibacter mali TaxID=2740462 RepID=A0A7D4PSX6_9SPHI|nr:outer membrane beta-barrel protein [Mucilaginibacter mali]QKJ29448.1 TonB-dependent receptor [Mucilaginibacter mali]
MYKQLLLPALLVLLAFMGMAQNRAEIKGKIIDSADKKPVEIVTVAVLHAKDTTAAALIAYAQTDKDGLFNVRNLPSAVPLKAVISFVGFRPYVKFFTLIKGQTLNMGTIEMAPKLLNEVTITAERMPITIRKDTIEFDAGAFKTKPNAVAEDLLKKLPGVEVDNSGKITVMGKDVSKILVDGKEFFSSDLRIASKNLDADLISKVQVYDDRENDPNHLIPDNEVNKIINLKFKKALKKSLFGKMYAGAGTQDHYQTGGLFNMFKDTLQVSALGYTNNLNSTGFDFNDLYTNGGGNRDGGAFSRSGIGFNFGGGNGRQTATSTGININTDYGKKFKVNLSYLYRHTNSAYNTITNQQQFLKDTTVITGSASDRMTLSDNHLISGSLTWKPDDATQLRYTPNATIASGSSSNANGSNSYSNFVNPINNSLNSSNSSNSSASFSQSLNYNHQLDKKGSSWGIDHNLNINPGYKNNSYDNQNLTSYVGALPSYLLKRFADNLSKSSSGTVSANYRKQVIEKKLNIDVSGGVDYNNSLDKASTYDYNPITGEYDSFVLMLSSDLNRISWKETINPGFTYNISQKTSIVGHLSTQWQQVTNIFQRGYNDIKQQFFFLTPNVSLRLNHISIGYSRNANIPNIGDMIPYSIVYSPQSSVTGNPDLKPAVSNRFTVSYNNYNYQKGLSFNLSGSYNFDENSIFRQRTINSQLVETSMPINRDGRYGLSTYAYLSKQVKKTKELQLSISANVNLSQNHDFFVINRQDGFQNSYRASFSPRVSLNYKDIVQFDPYYSISQVYTRYTGVAYNAQSNLTHSGGAHFMLYFPAKFNLEGNYTYQFNPQVAPGYQKSSNLLNLNLAHQFLAKDHGEIKLSCYDILNQNISNYRYVGANTITDTQSQIIKRYFMLTFQYRFNKSTVKGDEKPAPRPSGSMPIIIRY